MFKIKTIFTQSAIAVFGILMLISNITNAQEFHSKINEADVVKQLQFSYEKDSKYKTMTLTTATEYLSFRLQNNNDLLGPNVALADEIELYKGELVGKPNSWARFSNYNGNYTGAFFDGKDLFILKDVASISDTLSLDLNERANSMTNGDHSPMVLINAAKILHSGACGLHDHSEVERFGYVEYINELNNMTQSATIREISINLVADVEFVSGTSNASADMITSLNVADGIFKEQLNIQFVLTDTTELSDNGTLTSTNPETLIVAFRNSNFPNPGLRHLFTGKNLNGSTVGIAYVNSLCRSSSVGVTQRLGAATAIIFAHELGHNFGSPHDSENGSICSTTPSGFIMFPSVNTNADTFSDCSVSQMLPVINNATTGFDACVTEVDVGSAPVILSTPNESAIVGQDYSYDSDSRVDVSDAVSFTVALDIAPEGMTVDETGTIAWIPSAEQTGLNTVQISVSNQFGSDTQVFDVLVEQQLPPGIIDFSAATLNSYGVNQDRSGGAAIGDSNFELVLTGNTWKGLPFNYTITENTVLEFEFYSDVKAEIQGVGFDNDNNISQATTFNVFGTSGWGNKKFSYDTEGTYQLIRIPLGSRFSGSFDRLFFVLDNDLELIDASARFRNVRVFEEGVEEPSSEVFIDLSKLTFTPHSQSQDIEGTVTLTDNGFGVELVGNKWQRVTISGESITPNTVLSFEFKSTEIGDFHALGFFAGTSPDRSFGFNVYGTDPWRTRQFKYTDIGEFQTIVIPVGEFFTQSEIEMVFIMDHDVENPTGVSHFRNISFFESSE